MAIPSFDSFWPYVTHWSAETPDETALRFGEQKISYRELDLVTDRLASSFLGLGVEPGDRIATVLPPRPEYVFTFIAANKIGAITVPLDVRFRTADLDRFITAAEPKMLIAANASQDNPIAENLAVMASRWGEVEYFTLEPAPIGKVFSELLREAEGFEQRLEAAKAAQSPDDGALIIFTGGTTGAPKAALLSRGNVGAMCGLEAEAFRQYLAGQGFSGRARVLANLPPSHVGGTVELIGAQLAAGWEVLLQEQWSPTTVLETIVREKIPFIGAVPTMYAILLSLPDLDRFDLSCLRFVVLSGEKVSPELLEAVRAKICRNLVIGYGSTEAGAEVTFTDPKDPLEAVAQGYVGKPLPGVELKVVDEKDKSVPPGEVGEILVGGPLTIRGYFRMQEEDEEGFAGDGSCRTGDLGYLAEDGGLYVEGRKKHIIRVGSYSVLPAEVEEVVLRHPHVSTAAAVGIPHQIYGEVVWLVVAPKPGAAVAEAEIVDLCKRELADFKVPRKVVIEESLVTSRIGKVDRAKLREQLLASQDASEV